MNVKYKTNVLAYKQRQMEQELQKQINDVVPAVYASIALALFNSTNLELDGIKEIFAESQRLWKELGDQKMIELCERETGILLKGE
ncbi:MAG: hypothetical protein KBT27_13090 [Prevotellaceae bacterium]|nr:hypothetical protein [Candidatus Faecinaster equi]